MTQLLTRDPSAVGGPAERSATAESTQPDAGASAGSPAGWSASHPINIRLTLPTPWGQVFVLLIGGREQRGADRRRIERTRHPIATFGNILAMLLFGSVVGLAGLAAIQLATALMLGQPEISPP